MPTQNTTIDEGFEGCGSVRISYSPTATPRTPLLEDDAGRYLLVDRPEPTQALKIVLQYTPANAPYDYFAGTTEGTAMGQSFDGYTQEISSYTNPDTTFAFAQAPYTRYETVTTPYLPPSIGSQTNRLVYSERRRIEYDENDNPTEVIAEVFAFSMPVSSQSQQIVNANDGTVTLNFSYTQSSIRLQTDDGRSIDFETGEVSDGWAIVVYEVYEWGDSELSRVQFDSNPQPVTVECLESVCDDDCIPTYDSENNLLCICRDAEVNETDGYEYQPYEHNQTRPRYNEYTP
jgi:hypothetical protein